MGWFSRGGRKMVLTAEHEGEGGRTTAVTHELALTRGNLAVLRKVFDEVKGEENHSELAKDLDEREGEVIELIFKDLQSLKATLRDYKARLEEAERLRDASDKAGTDAKKHEALAGALRHDIEGAEGVDQGVLENVAKRLVQHENLLKRLEEEVEKAKRADVEAVDKLEADFKALTTMIAALKEEAKSLI